MENYHRILGVRPGASKREIRQAYRELIKVWHPDRFQNDPSLQQKAQEKTKEITEAYRALSGPDAPAAAARAWSPARAAAAAAARALKSRGDASGVRAFIVFVLAGAAALGAVYGFLVWRENSRRVMVNGVSFNEWEWSRRFRPGSTKDEVMAVQGAPDRSEGETWFYGNDWIRFGEDSRVAGYSNAGGALRVKEDAAEASRASEPAREAAGFFTLGSTREEVLRAQGPPTHEAGDEWRWGKDAVFFSKGRVSHYDNTAGRLRVKVLPATTVSVSKDSAFTLGSSKDEVLAIQGTPSRMAGDLWLYGLDTVTFSRGRVLGWSNAARGLKVRLVPSRPVTPKPGARFTIGSTADDVIAIQGTPTRVEGNVWRWGLDSATFSGGRIVAFENRTGFLKAIKLGPPPPAAPAPKSDPRPAPKNAAETQKSGWEGTRFEESERDI